MKGFVVRGLLGLTGLGSVSVGCSTTPASRGLPQPSAEKPTLKLPCGTFTGSVSQGIESYNGIPYAEPPVGPLRLKPPRKLSRNLGRVDVSGKAAACPQLPMNRENATNVARNALSVFKLPFWQMAKGQEDCLTVSVQRPARLAPGEKLPVLVWVHGGFYEVGSSSAYDAATFLSTAAEGGRPFVFVSVNYRLGGFGFMPGSEILKDGSANLGLLDQRAALEWVADNIEGFNGDPEKVTIWGESAGAYSVVNQMALFDGSASNYNGKPLFRGAIMNSGSLFPADRIDCPKGQAVYDAVVKKAGCQGQKDTLSCLRGLDYEAFLDATAANPGFLSYNAAALSYLPRPDGQVLTASVDELVETGRYHAVPAIISSQEDEGTIFSMLQQPIKNDEDFTNYLSELYFQSAPKDQLAELVHVYTKNGESEGSPFRAPSSNSLYPYYKRIAAWTGDYCFTLTRRKFLELTARVNPSIPTWSCLSSTYRDTPNVGTFHTSDLAQIFYDTKPTPATLSWRQYYINFVYSLDPNKGKTSGSDWPLWKDNKMLLWFETQENVSHITDDFRSEAFAVFNKIWGSLRQ
ncbi:hypothetical protein CDD83_3624 [Cordyceps sp. RAO-2017]|nr:hypothetical protein CDD83_3624 [Cordyceps sp. RAO-2017]